MPHRRFVLRSEEPAWHAADVDLEGVQHAPEFLDEPVRSRAAVQGLWLLELRDVEVDVTVRSVITSRHRSAEANARCAQLGSDPE